MRSEELPVGGWRGDAVEIVERLLTDAGPEGWDLLLDLRAELLDGVDWRRMLDLFMRCRDRLGLDHYLPFYRLRRLMASSLRLEVATGGGARRTAALAELLRSHRSFEQFEKALRRDWFEHDLGFEAGGALELTVEEAR